MAATLGDLITIESFLVSSVLNAVAQTNGSSINQVLTTPVFSGNVGSILATSLSLSGTGIAFPANQNPSSDVNTLDDYEEGTWTPTITLGVTSPSYSAQIGRYTKIGNFVYVSARCNLSSGTVTGSVLNISLPFTVSNNGSSIFPAGSCYFNAAAGNAINARAIAIDNAPTMQWVIQNATGQTAFLGTDYGSGGSVNFTLIYQVA
jgi:hypothetical protein